MRYWYIPWMNISLSCGTLDTIPLHVPFAQLFSLERLKKEIVNTLPDMLWSVNMPFTDLSVPTAFLQMRAGGRPTIVSWRERPSAHTRSLRENQRHGIKKGGPPDQPPLEHHRHCFYRSVSLNKLSILHLSNSHVSAQNTKRWNGAVLP